VVKDTLSGDTLDLVNITRNIEEEKYFQIFTASQDSGTGYRISVSQLEDTSGNVQMEVQNAEFVGSAVRDTTTFKLLKLNPQDSISNVKLTTSISMEFSMPIDTGRFFNQFDFWDKDSIDIQGQWTWRGLTHGFFRPFEEFDPSQQYFYSLSTNSLNSLWGDTLPDTTYVRTFFIVSEDEFGSLSGNFQTQLALQHEVYVQVIPLNKRKMSYIVAVNENNEFHIDWIEEGRYKLGGFIDIDNNKEFSPGNLYPFKFSEPFTILDDTLRIRKRWELADLKFYIPGW
jgi:hypothetical protein